MVQMEVHQKMNLGEPIRELEVAPLEWPQSLPVEKEPVKEEVPVEVGDAK